MEWIVKITNKPNQRIRIKLMPMADTIEMYGEYKQKNSWNTFHYVQYNSDLSLDELQDIMFEVYEKMKERIEKHDDLVKTFEKIKEIQIVDDDNLNEDVYGIA